MTELDDPFPRDSEGKRYGGPFHWIAVDDFPQALEIGWRPLPLTDKYAHPVTDGRGVFCEWRGKGEMRLPT
jgi:hypothetical protein